MHARNLAQHPDVEQIILIGRDSQRVEAARTRVNDAVAPGALSELAGEHPGAATPAEVGTTTRVNDALRSIDGLVIATTTASHPGLVRQAARAGVPALVEKPLALDVDELAGLADELDAYKTPVMVAFHRRYDTGYQRLRDRLLAGDAGTIRLVRATGHDHHPLTLDYIPASGGIFRDLMIHDFDIIPWVTSQRVTQVQALGAVLDEPTYAEYGDADTAVVLLTFESGAFATVSGIRRNGAGHDVRLEVYGTENTFSAGLDARTPVTSTESGVASPPSTYDDFSTRFEPAFRNEADHFLRVIRGTAPNLTPPRAGLVATRIAAAAEESRRTGQPVTIAD